MKSLHSKSSSFFYYQCIALLFEFQWKETCRFWYEKNKLKVLKVVQDDDGSFSLSRFLQASSNSRILWSCRSVEWKFTLGKLCPKHIASFWGRSKGEIWIFSPCGWWGEFKCLKHLRQKFRQRVFQPIIINKKKKFLKFYFGKKAFNFQTVFFEVFPLKKLCWTLGLFTKFQLNSCWKCLTKFWTESLKMTNKFLWSFTIKSFCNLINFSEICSNQGVMKF